MSETKRPNILVALFKIALVATGATVMAIFGLFLIAAAGDGHFDFALLGKSAVRSILIWTVFFYILPTRPVLRILWIGVIAPGYGLVMFFGATPVNWTGMNLLIALFIGAVTGFSTWVIRFNRTLAT